MEKIILICLFLFILLIIIGGASYSVGCQDEYENGEYGDKGKYEDSEYRRKGEFKR